jgi:uncharacterized RDD family membrane protein YckC
VSDFGPDKPTRVLARRYFAYLIDVVLHAAAVLLPLLLLSNRGTRTRQPGEGIVDAFRLSPDYAIRVDDRIFLLTKNDLFVIGAISLGFGLLFTVFIQGRFGWTIGKALTGLRTVRGDGGRPGILRALGRTILLPIDAIPSWLIPIVGSLVALFTSDNRRLGDLVAGTYVVHKGAVGDDPTGRTELDTSSWLPQVEEPAPVTTLGDGEALRVGGAAATVSAPESEPEDTGDRHDGEGEGETKAPAYRPQWDPARQAYLQWDPREKTWLEFDEDSKEWRAIG